MESYFDIISNTVIVVFALAGTMNQVLQRFSIFKGDRGLEDIQGAVRKRERERERGREREREREGGGGGGERESQMVRE